MHDRRLDIKKYKLMRVLSRSLLASRGQAGRKRRPTKECRGWLATHPARTGLYKNAKACRFGSWKAVGTPKKNTDREVSRGSLERPPTPRGRWGALWEGQGTL